MNPQASDRTRASATESNQLTTVATDAPLTYESGGEWRYPNGALEATACQLGKLYRIQFKDDDWDFTMPGDSDEQDVQVYQARRTQTQFGIEWFVVGVERWTYKDDELIVLGAVEAD